MYKDPSFVKNISVTVKLASHLSPQQFKQQLNKNMKIQVIQISTKVGLHSKFGNKCKTNTQKHDH